jgi:hypothetical protein
MRRKCPLINHTYDRLRQALEGDRTKQICVKSLIGIMSVSRKDLSVFEALVLNDQPMTYRFST